MTSSLISKTGRVESWIEDPAGRLPVSCTVFVVDNELESENGIEASWRFASHALRNGAGVAIHLSKLDPKGYERPSGVVASGPVSFGRIYSSLNETLRRGGKYKNGAIVLHLDADHPDIEEFITAPREALPWVKRCVNLSPAMWHAMDAVTRQKLYKGIASGDIWLTKIRYNEKCERIYANVCLEVLLPSRGTCLLSHVNLGACKVETLSGAFVEGMSELCSLHGKTGVGETGEYLPSETDRQVGLGLLGLANLLRRYKVTYEEFGDALWDILNKENQDRWTIAHDLATALQNGIQQAAFIAKEHNMERAFAIAPTASCSYRSRDLDGYTCTPEIAPPIARTVDRDSGTFGVETFSYGEVEIASEVGWDNYNRVVNGIVEMYSRTGLWHSYSYNTWSDVVTYDREFIEEWLVGPQTSMYYALQVMPDTQDKTDAYAALEEAEVEDYLAKLLNGEDELTCDCQE
nr:hypothetical protein 15 [bacterium]